MNKRLNKLTIKVSIMADSFTDDHPLALCADFLSQASDDLCDASMEESGSMERALALSAALQNVDNAQNQSERTGFPASLRIEVCEFADRFNRWVESLQA
jgi:hypothetical protein